MEFLVLRRLSNVRMSTLNVFLLALAMLVLGSLASMLALLRPEEVQHVSWIVSGHVFVLIVVALTYCFAKIIVGPVREPMNRKKEVCRR
jgi:hypothetical protein